MVLFAKDGEDRDLGRAAREGAFTEPSEGRA